jgi:hypothetical protein
MHKDELIDAGSLESEKFEPDDEIRQEFSDVQRLASGREILLRQLREHHSKSPELSGGDIDADWEGADVGDETVGGSSATPNQDVVEELGGAVGLTYQDDEPLHSEDKLQQRDRNRWELDPASSEDYIDRVNKEGE